MFNQFTAHITQNLAFLKDAKLLLAISGGMDSVLLSYLCNTLHLNITLAHCNFNLRATESDKDQQFVENLAKSLNVEVFVRRFNTYEYAQQNKCSLQMAARELRYNWFLDIAEQLHFDYILTAHHADDNLETFLINFMRGTGINGLSGIPPVNDKIVRPLLPFSRVSIEAYAKTKQLQWREDSSNSSRKYLRNKLRHEVVPVLKQINPQLLSCFQDTINHLKDTVDMVSECMHAFTKRTILSSDAGSTTYKISEFKKVSNPKAYVFHIFKEYGFTQWNDIIHLLDAENGKYVSSSTHKIQKFRNILLLTKLKYDVIQTTKSNSVFIDNVLTTVKFPNGILRFQYTKTFQNNLPTTIYIEAEKLQFPLELRPWRSIDKFQPIGMNGQSKKILKFLKDEKLSPSQKTKVWVLTSKNHIIWVVGLRADERFKVTSKTGVILKIEKI